VSRGERASIDRLLGVHHGLANATAGTLVTAVEAPASKPHDPTDNEPVNCWDPEVLAHEAREQR